MINKCAIVIPLYTNNLKKYELDSIESAKRNFNENDIFFTCPNNLDITNVCDDEKRIVRFSGGYFNGIIGYCLLCTSSLFYREFENRGYNYILIHQTDTYTFYNNLDYFMNLNYDYYGAPIYGITSNKKSLWYKSAGVGNGGYSLRKIPKMIEVTDTYGPVNIVEDAWFCSKQAKFLNICPVDIAKKFSTIGNTINGDLPMGCHGYIVKKELYKKYDKKNIKMEKNKNVIYTCITGGYDGLIEPLKKTPGYDYVCFTDDLSITSNTWIIKPLPDDISELDNTRKNRYIKMHPHILFPEYETSIYIDGSIKILKDLTEFVKSCDLNNYSIAIPKHPCRSCLYKEAKTCISIKKDTAEHINPQIEKYKTEGFPENYGLTQNNIIVRKHNNKDCIKIMEDWWQEVLNGSYRDQLSLMYVLWKNKDIKIKQLPSNTCNSSNFKWGTHRNKTTSNVVKKKVTDCNITQVTSTGISTSHHTVKRLSNTYKNKKRMVVKRTNPIQMHSFLR